MDSTAAKNKNKLRDLLINENQEEQSPRYEFYLIDHTFLINISLLHQLMGIERASTF